MKIKVKDRQSLIDIAVQTSGNMESSLAIAIKNDIAISQELQDIELETAEVGNQLVLTRYRAENIRPATEISQKEAELVPFGGIGFMGIEIDFIIN